MKHHRSEVSTYVFALTLTGLDLQELQNSILFTVSKGYKSF